MTCWLAANGVMENDRPMAPCDGRLVRCHLIPKALLSREDLTLYRWDERCWVWACGGPMGNSGHHGMLDVSRKLRIPRENLPVDLEQFAAEVEVVWWLEREYGSAT